MPSEYKKTMAACCIGYVTQSIVVNLAPLFFVIFSGSYGFSYSYIATLVLVTFAVQIAVDGASVLFAPRLGYRRCAVLSQVISAAGIALLGILPAVMGNKHAAVMTAVVVYSVGGALIEVVVSPIIDAIPTKSDEASMSFLHAFYSWGQVFVILVTTLLLIIVGHSSWYAIPVIWTAVPLTGLFMFLKVPIIDPGKESSASRAPKFFKSGAFMVSMLLMICAGASEQIMAQWASLFCERGLGVAKAVGDLLGPCLFAAFMGIGRTLYGTAGEKLDLRRALRACSLLCIVCYFVTVFSGSAFLSLAGCAFCGLGVSLLWPGMLSMSSAAFPTGGAAMFALLALGGDLGCSLGPYVTGVVSDAVSKNGDASGILAHFGSGIDEISLKAGILAGIVFPVIMLIGTFFVGRRDDSVSE